MVLSKKKKDWWRGFIPSDVSSVIMWLDDPAFPGNVIESANRVSEWTGEVGGVNGDQLTGADQPLRVGSELQFDGSSEFMDLVDLFALVSGDTQGEIFVVCKSGADGTVGREFCLADDATDDRFFQFFINGTLVAGEHRLQLNHNDGGAGTGVNGNTDIVEDTLVIINGSSNGSRWRLAINDIEQSLTVTGANNGNWFGDVTGADNIRLSSLGRLSEIFGIGTILSVIYSNEELSSDNRTLVRNFLNSLNRSWGNIF